eukprot:5305816-Pyramimonas_sp.AAC.1
MLKAHGRSRRTSFCASTNDRHVIAQQHGTRASRRLQLRATRHAVRARARAPRCTFDPGAPPQRPASATL